MRETCCVLLNMIFNCISHNGGCGFAKSLSLSLPVVAIELSCNLQSRTFDRHIINLAVGSLKFGKWNARPTMRYMPPFHIS